MTKLSAQGERPLSTYEYIFIIILVFLLGFAIGYSTANGEPVGSMYEWLK